MAKWNYYWLNPDEVWVHRDRKHDQKGRICLPKAYHYAKLIEQGAKMPPVGIYVGSDGLIRANDGSHRVFAHRLLKRPVLVKTKHVFSRLPTALPEEVPTLAQIEYSRGIFGGWDRFTHARD